MPRKNSKEITMQQMDALSFLSLKEKRSGHELLDLINEDYLAHGRAKRRYATLYTCLRTLEDNGLVISGFDGSDERGARIRYYRLTEKGRRAYNEEWQRSIKRRHKYTQQELAKLGSAVNGSNG